MGIKLLNSDAYSKCYTVNQISSAKGSVIKNTDGTVTVFIPNNVGVLTPVPLGKACCEALDSSYSFDINSQKCRWSLTASCDFNSPINVNIFSNGNDGSMFLIDEGEKCDLNVSFDYLFKIKCESLYKVLFPTTIQDPNTLKQINILNNKILEDSVKAESIQNQILLLEEQIKTTLYSINCDSFPYDGVVAIGTQVPAPTTNVTTSTLKGNFGKSGFGNLSPMSMAEVSYYSVNFCLTEPTGLSIWANILGEEKYTQFLDGVPSSYTCNDVINLYNQNTNGNLINVCTTPFGAKTQLIKQQNQLFIDLANIQNTLTDSKLKLTNLQATLSNTIAGCKTPIEALETLKISMGIEVINANNTTENVFTEKLLDIGTGNLYKYLTGLPATNNNNSALYICGDPSKNDVNLSPCTVLSLNNNSFTQNVSSCDSIIKPLLNSLLAESKVSTETFNQKISSNVFASGWVNYKTLITDSEILAKIGNKKIKLTLTINDTCVDVCILLDNIVLDKKCTVVDTEKIEIIESPGFNLSRVRDNKKSWVSTSTPTNREFLISKTNDTNPIRQTDYNLNDERLVINTKEIDLNVNIASAIENDVWSYIVDNPCLLTGVTTCDPCTICDNKTFQDGPCLSFQDEYPYEYQDGSSTGNQKCCGDNKLEISNLLTSSLSAVTTIEGFENLLISELIDVKNRKTISSYPTLRALYDRYMHSSDYCDTNSSKFDYNTIDSFSNLIGDYWVDIIEQVIPATTIWGSVKIYSNTIFDDQKFRYRQYSTLICTNPFDGFNLPSPINGSTGNSHAVQVEIEMISLPSNEVTVIKKPTSPCSLISVGQMNSGSEFVGSVYYNDMNLGNCVMSDWTEWSSCVGLSESGGTQTRTRTIITEPMNGGLACGPLTETRACCVRPTGLALKSYLTSAWDDGVTTVNFTGYNVPDVCSEFVNMQAATTSNYLSYYLEAESLTIGKKAYKGLSSACTYFEDGNYWYDTSSDGPTTPNYSSVSEITVVSVSGEVITAITQCPLLPLSLSGSSSIKFDVEATTPSKLLVDWGDSTVEAFSLTSSPILTLDHTYSSPYTGEIKLKTNNSGIITGFTNFISSAITNDSIAFTTTELGAFTGLSRFLCSDSVIGAVSNIISGDIANLPPTLTRFLCGGNNTTTGDIGYLPTGLTLYRNTGLNTTFGDIANLPLGLKTYDNEGNNTTTGDIAYLPTGLTSYDNRGINSTYGDIGSLPNTLTYYLNWGNGSGTGGTMPFQSTSGDLAGLSGKTNLTYYNNLGRNTTFGDIANLPINLQTFQNWGSTVSGTGQITSGNISSLKSKLIYYGNQGANTVTGTLQSMTAPTGLTYFESIGFNTISGEIHNIPFNTTYFSLQGRANNLAYSGKTWKSAATGGTGVQFVFINSIDNSIDINETSQLVIDLAAATWSQLPNVTKRVATVNAFSALTPTAQIAVTGVTGLNSQGVTYTKI